MQFTILASIIIYLSAFISMNCAPTDEFNPETETDIEPQPQVDSSLEEDKLDYYERRHDVAEGVQKALDVCREKFKWDRWNCPKRAFLDILDGNPLPSNKELGLTRALIASGIVLSLTKSCSYGTNNVCRCSQTTTDPATKNKFAWTGCDEIINFGFKVSRIYLESQDLKQDDASRRINSRNYEVGRLAVKKNMKRVCKCHGPSGSCQYKTCWTTIPDMSKVGDYLRHQYKLAAKVGAMSAEETNTASLNKELANIKQDKLVFADASPDYCYEHSKLGINGTLGRYCSRRSDGTEVSRDERDSCTNLCTKCGYKVKRERLESFKQCDCRFVYCCSIECRRCPYIAETFKCVKHS